MWLVDTLWLKERATIYKLNNMRVRFENKMINNDVIVQLQPTGDKM